MTKLPAEFWIKHLQLSSHVEGGSFGEVYRSPLKFPKDQLPLAFNGDRNSCTHIYFLLQKNQFSAFHRICSDELWHFYYGDPLVIYEIEPDGTLKEHLLGNDPRAGQSLFCVIRSGNWFASRITQKSDYALVGCTVSPGFDFADFELAKKEKLTATYPQHTTLINQLTC